MTTSTEPSDWPRRVAVEIVEHQWNHGILVTRIPAWDTDGTVGHNQEDVPREVWDQPVGTIIHAVLYVEDEDPDFGFPAAPLFRDWEWDGGAERSDLTRAINNAEAARATLRYALAQSAAELPTLRGAERGQLMRRLRGVDLTLQEIGDLFGVTREAVRQTVYRAGTRRDSDHA